MCRSCGKVYIWNRRSYCSSCIRAINRSPAWFAKAKLELSTPYSNGRNTDFETRLKQLETLQKEQPL
jgi:hypothetical protein